MSADLRKVKARIDKLERRKPIVLISTDINEDRLVEVELAVAELQKYAVITHPVTHPLRHLIQPPTEQSDCDKCANKDCCNGRGEKCNDFVTEPTVKEKYE